MRTDYDKYVENLEASGYQKYLISRNQLENASKLKLKDHFTPKMRYMNNNNRALIQGLYIFSGKYDVTRIDYI